MFVRPMTLTLIAVVAGLAMVLPLVPEPYRAFNVALFGAVGLFAAARVGLWPALVISLVAKMVSDFVNYAAHGYNADYLPMWEVLLSFAVYPLCGRLVKRTQNPFAIGGAAVLGSVLFFLVTNFGSWVRLANNRPLTFDGLMLAYQDGLPFYKATFVSDLLCTVAMFAAHAVLSRVYFPAERVAPVFVPVNERS